MLTLGACGTLPSNRGWGEDATLDPGRDRINRAAERAVRDPGTWIPALAAAVMAASGADARLSDWARDKAPVFGNGRNAAVVSDDLRDYTNVGMFATALMTPSGPQDEWLENKSRGVAVEAGAVLATIGTTNLLKDVVGREQPGGQGTESFTSNHATEPFARAALIRRNTDWLGLPGWAETAVDASFYLMAAGSAWARVEAGLHYPSDQLAGAAIGNFIALFIHDAFLGLNDEHRGISAQADPVPTIGFYLRW
ncbi:MAG: phosphatase PAP2 family protein [Thiohalomonadaceae bacterium]